MVAAAAKQGGAEMRREGCGGARKGSRGWLREAGKNKAELRRVGRKEKKIDKCREEHSK